jgi:hypothetical protein
MSITAAKPATTPIPVQLSETEFTVFILLHLSMPKRGPCDNSQQWLYLGPPPGGPMHETDMVLLAKGLQALKKVAQQVGVDLRGASLNRDGGFDSTYSRQRIFDAGMIPNSKENPRHRKTSKRGRKRFFNEAIHALRTCGERTFAWEDKLKGLLLRFERIQQRHYGMKLMAYPWIKRYAGGRR